MAENTKMEASRMSAICDHEFKPWKESNGTRVVAAESMWKKPLKWNRDAACMVECVNPDCRDRRIVPYGQEETFCPKCGDPEGEAVRPRVLCESLADVFEDWQGPINNSHGDSMMICPKGHIDSWVWESAPKQIDCSHSCGDDMRLMTMKDVRNRLFKLIDATPNLDWLLVTKRPENIRRMIPEKTPFGNLDPIASTPYGHSMRKHRDNVWLLTSVEDQEAADKRIPELLKCRDLAPVLGLSMEPLLGPVDLTRWFGPQSEGQWMNVVECGHRSIEYGINWIIVGGESGPGARPMHPDWVRSIRDQCQAAGVPFFMKQWGEWAQASDVFDAGPNTTTKPCRKRMTVKMIGNCKMLDCGKKAAGRTLDGKTWDQFPEVK